VINNFNFLRNECDLFYILLKEAEVNLFIDHDTSVYKIRKFGEIIVEDILVKEKIEGNCSSHFEALKELEYQNKIDVNVLEFLHDIRMKGNDSVHGKTCSLIEADNLLEKSFYVATYYYKKYCDSSFVLPVYQKSILKHKDRIKVYTDEVVITREEKEYFSRAMKILMDHYLNCIVDIYLGRPGKLEEIEGMSFAKFYSHYSTIIKFFAEMSDDHMYMISNLKNIAKKKLQTTDHFIVNKEIAKQIYINTPWFKII